ncbi:protein-methionine sulfoxide oxidase mical3a [Rhincodon typus]|uniref:protein-methionine sulfoxide oxidase mical3a n=1 Tax=Rhincodon typus TaxID=259920 RepID=UPI00202F4434|nr:protein-methionine sulfoxide oxidase mical3a [Rhincodon typus]
MGDGEKSKIEQSHLLFDNFIQATTCKGTFKGFQELCEILTITKIDFPNFYPKLKSKLNYWKAKALFSKLDKRGSHKDYKKNTACANTKCLVIGAGPCGLRTAIELAFLGAKAIIVEKRDTFSRNNVLHLWPYTIQDLRNLGAKKIYGKFCAGAIDHISIRQLQLVLLKIALILGVEIHLNVEFRGLLPPRGQNNPNAGWRAEINPPTSKVTQFEFDAVIGADGRRNTLEGFRRKEFRGKLAIAITANFINRHTREEAQAQEISGVAFIFNQKFFQDLREATGVDLENIVYYKDDTHYFVMTAKKQSLLEKGVILQVESVTISRTQEESIYRLLPQTTPSNISKNYNLYSIDPVTRYPKVNIHVLDENQVRHLYNTGEQKNLPGSETAVIPRSPKFKQSDSLARSNKLLAWCQKQTQGYKNVNVIDLTTSWKSGLALCAIIHRYRPDLIDFDQLNEKDVESNNQMAFDIAEREFGISPVMTGKEMAAVGEPDKLSMVMYLSQFYEMLKDTAPEEYLLSFHDKSNIVSATKSPISFLSRLGQSITRKRGPKELFRHKSVAKLPKKQEERDPYQKGSVKSIANQFLAKSNSNAPGPSHGLKRQRPNLFEDEDPDQQPHSRPGEITQLNAGPQWKQRRDVLPLRACPKTVIMLPWPLPGSSRCTQQSMKKKEFPSQFGGSDVCYFCGKRVYVMERLSAEGKFFHRGCFKCAYCGVTLRLASYAYNPENGKFYCKPHYRLAGREARKRSATPPAQAQEKISPPPLPTMNPVEVPDSKMQYTDGAAVAFTDALAEPCQAKRIRSTPERIELENIRVSLEREEDLQEVPEETLAEHNLSSAFQQISQEPDSSCSSSEYEMEDDEEEEEDEEDEENAQAPSDLGGVPWMEAVRIHRLLKGDLEGDSEPEDEEQSESSYASDAPPFRNEAVRAWLDSVSREQQIEVELSPDEDDDVEDEEDDDGAAFDDDIASDAEAENLISYTEELEQLVREKEEACGEIGTPGGFKPAQGVHSVSRLDLQLLSDRTQKSQPEQQLDLQSPRGPFVTPLDSERRMTSSQEVSTPLSDHPPVQSQPLCYPETPSSCSPVKSQPTVSSLAQSSGTAPSPRTPLVRSPGTAPPHPTPQAQSPGSGPSPHTPLAQNPGTTPSHPCPLAQSPSSAPSPVVSLPQSPSSAPSPVISLPQSPGTAPSVICCQPLTCSEVTISIKAQSPVKTQPVCSILTSTPLITLSTESHNKVTERLADLGGDKLSRKDPVDEFWLRSMELRRNLGVSPVDRTSGSETSFTLSTTGSASPQSFTPDEMFEEHRSHTASPPLASRTSSISGMEEQPLASVTPSPSTGLDPKSSDGAQHDLSSTSGLGLNGSLSNTRTAASVSLNNSDSMLTPPSSPPPPPPAGEEPATLRRRKIRERRASGTESSPALVSSEQLGPAHDTAGGSQPDSMRKSLADSIDEIPFADDVEDTYDDRTPDTSIHEQFYTPPSSQPKQEKVSPLHLAQAAVSKLTTPKQRLLTYITPEAKEIAKERMRARERSVKSQVLRDAMEKQLRKMRDMEMSEDSPGQARIGPRQARAQEAAWPDTTFPSSIRLTNGHKQEMLGDRFLSPTAIQESIVEGSGASSEDSAGKIKKRASLFSPRKSKKEKKSKSDSRQSQKASGPAEDLPKPKSLWKSVFSSYRKDRKKKEETPCSSTPSSSNTIDSSSKHSRNILHTAAGLQLGQHLSLSEDSDLSSDDVLERNSQWSRREKPYTEEELNSKLTRRVQRAARRQAKQEELKRLHRAQIIQRQLEQVEEKQRQLEERGVAVEKALRGEADYWGESSYSEILDLHLGGMGKKDDPRLMQEWFKLVQEKNSLVRYESELMIFARELELEDRQSRLQQELRERMAIDAWSFKQDRLKLEGERTLFLGAASTFYKETNNFLGKWLFLE